MIATQVQRSTLWVASLASIAPGIAGLTGIPALGGVGLPAATGWLLASIPLLSLTGAAAVLLRRGRLGALVAVPALWSAIAAIVLVEASSALDLGVSDALFGDRAGEPKAGFFLASVILLLSVQLLMAPSARRATSVAIYAVAGATAEFAFRSLILTLSMQAPAGYAPLIGSSLPLSIAAVSFAVAILAWRRAHLTSALLLPSSRSLRSIWISLALLLLLPLGEPALLALAVPDEALGTGLAIMLAPALYVAGACGLIALFQRRLAIEHDALLKQEARLGLAIETPGIGIFDWDMKTGALAWTATAEIEFGLAPGAMRDIATWRSMVDPDDLPAIERELAVTRQGHHEHFPFRFRMRDRAGNWRTIEGTARCFYSNEGELIRLVGMNVDVTERDRRERALQGREAQLRSILETVPDAMIIVSEQGVIRDFSAAAEAMFGHRAAAILGQNIDQLLPGAPALLHNALNDPPAGRDILDQVGRGPALIARRANGRTFPIELTVGQAWADGMRVFIAFVRDISARVAARERLEQLNREYAHAARLGAMGEVAGGLAHELNQPLTASTNYLGTAKYLLREGALAAPVIELIEQATAQLHRAGEIIRRLRNFIAKRDADAGFESLDAILADAIALGLVGSQFREMDIQFNLAPDATRVIADRVQIQQVLTNLVRNAAEAVHEMPADQRRITIVSRRHDEDFIKVGVEDSGPGFPPDLIGREIESFSSTKGPHGMGLGLLICRRIVEAHRGAMEISNLPGGGACVAFTLPAAPLGETQDIQPDG